MSVTYRFKPPSVSASLWWGLDFRSLCLLSVVGRSGVVSVLDADKVLLGWGVFVGFSTIPLGVVGEVSRFDVEGFVVL
jgi:hypothetical protein